jgi:hypothetical protein
MHERARDRDALQLTPRERVRQARLEAGEADRGQHGGDARRVGRALEQQRQADVGGDGQVRQDVERLEDEAEVMAPEHRLRRFAERVDVGAGDAHPGRRRWCRGPAAQFRSVDLPTPDSPTTATNSPAPSTRSTPSKTVLAP